MPRRSRINAASNAQARASGKAPSNTPFSALAKLRKEVLEGSGRQSSSPDPQQSPRARTASPSDSNVESTVEGIAAEDLALFLEASGGARPLRDDGRAELERPRPAPLRRTRGLDEEKEEQPVRRGHPDPLGAAYENVTPLRESGRVELGTYTRFRARNAEAAAPPGPLHPPSGALPSDIDPNDPAAIFRHAMHGARPLENRNRVTLERTAPAPSPLKREEDERAALDESLSAPLSFEDRLDMGDEAAFLRTGIPRRVLSDLRRGRWVLQGQIDLHGFTRDEAREALGHFLVSSLQQGHRCIRVIQGKGLGSPGRISILKQLSRGWLAQREEILAFCQAGPNHGGSGALLVLMRAQNASRD